MSANRLSRIQQITPWVYLCGGVAWLYDGLRRFDLLSFLNGYQLPEYRRLHQQGGAGVLLPCTVGLLFLIAAVLTFRRQRRNPGNEVGPAVTTLFGPGSDNLN